MIGIRCDANSIIASGHMMRCLTIAKELVRLGEPVTFFLADEESKRLFDAYVGADSAGAKIDAVVLGTKWDDMEAELPVLTKELKARNAVSVITDSYSVTPEYFQALKEICPVAYIDDLNADTYPVDLLINYSGYYKTLGYEEAYKDTCGYRGTPTKLLLGLEYAPLREQFYRSADGSAKDSTVIEHGAESNDAGVSSVLLTSGGADTRGMLLSTLKAAQEAGLISAKENMQWQVVVGSLVKDAADIEAFAKAHDNVTIHRAVTDMAGLMRKCDVAICAAGTMLTECAAIGLPAIFYQVADNQKYNVEFWSATGGMLFAGDVTEAPDGVDATSTESTVNVVAKNICAYLINLSDANKLQAMRESLTGITDGRGAIRIAEALMHL